MKLDTPKAIIIGSIIIVAGLFFVNSYQKQLSYKVCVRMWMENPVETPREPKFGEKWFFEKACEYNVYVMNGNLPNFIPNFQEK